MAVQLLAPEEVGQGMSLARSNGWYTTAVALVFAVLAVHTAMAAAQTGRYDDAAVIDQGSRLFSENCAICHGNNAQGTVENWQQRDQNGKFPPPPLNGTAHTWHHPIHALGQVIHDGTEHIGGSMPAWKDRLTEDEIFAVIMYLGSLWPDEIYQAWMQRNQQQ